MIDEEEPSPEEIAEAARIAGQVDGLLAGRTTHGDPDLTAAAAIHAARPLPFPRREALLRAIFVPRRRRAYVPWVTAALAAAAALVLALRPPPRRPPPVRSASALVGRIDEAAAADAGARLDVVYAERMNGHRARLLAGAPR